MMKLTSMWFAIVVAAIFVHSASAETMIRTIFNNGVVTEGLSCTADEKALIDKVFDRPLTRRNLRTSNVNQVPERPMDVVHEITPGNDNEEGRFLQAVGSPAYCKRECENWAPGSCHVTKCGWYNNNRNLQNYGKGFVSNSTYCRTTVDSISADLDYLVSQNMVSSPCIALLNAPRHIECYEDVMNGIVEEFRVFNSDTDTVLVPFIHARMTICGLNPLNIQVKVNPCVDTVTMNLVNKKANFKATVVHDTTIPGPYTLFGMNGKGDYNGQHLPFGNYTLDATPDGNRNKTRSRMFYLDSC